MTGVLVEWFKWPAAPYRVTPMMRLGSDEHGTWLFAPKGAAATYAATGAAPLPVNFLTLLPPGEQWWLCTWMWGNPTIDIELYVDIVHPPAWTSDSCLQVVDLDLDVIRYRDGRVLLDDGDEFAEHSVSLSYPPSVSASARAAATDLFAAVAEKTSPFTARPDRWVQVAAQRSKET